MQDRKTGFCIDLPGLKIKNGLKNGFDTLMMQNVLKRYAFRLIFLRKYLISI